MESENGATLVENSDNQNSKTTAAPSDFTIEHILTRAGRAGVPAKNELNFPSNYPWLQCTRYTPPRIRSKLIFHF